MVLVMNALNTIYLRLRIPSSSHFNVLNVVKQYSTHSERIVAPKKIHKEPTDVLKALASTVQSDPTAPHYKYHDDPFLIPRSNLAKRSFALSKESGRKTAQWIRAQHPDIFQHKVANPPIEAFYPKPVYDENSEVNEDTLKKLIDDVLISDAITVYELLQQKKQCISDSTVQSLLELLCFFNSEDILPEDMIEERWFRQGFSRREKRKTWKDNGLAETIFRTMESPTSAAYSALLQGMTRFYQVDRAWQLYQEMQEKEIPLTVEGYNSLIRVVCFLREGNELRWQLVQELLTAMEKQGLKPNIGTLNSVLETISGMGYQKHVKTFALRVLAELKHTGVQPSLASYYFLLITFCKERGVVNPILVDIMKVIEGQSFKIEDPRDTFFFVTAMDICRNHLQDVELAHRVDKLLHTGNNYDLIGDSFKESIYYRHYFILQCNMEPLEVFWQNYNRLVPNIYIPEPAVMEEVIKVVDLNGAPEYFPRLWSDMVIFDQVERPNNVEAILSGMVKNEPQASSELTNQFAEIASDAWNKLEIQFNEDTYRQFRWTGQMLGDLMVLFSRGDKLGSALDILNKLEKDQNSVVGVPSVEALQLFVDTCISQNEANTAIKCIQYCVDAGYSEAGQLAQLLHASLELDEDQKRKLTNIVGEKALQQSAAAEDRSELDIL